MTKPEGPPARRTPACPAQAGSPEPRSPDRRRASRNPPMREDNKNLLLAIVLSVAVLLGWNFFFAAPQTDAAAAAQPATAQPSGRARRRPTGAPSPSQAGGPAAPVPGTVPGGRRRAGGRAARGGARALARASRIDTPVDPRLDQPARRAHRRRGAEELPRDGRPAEPEHRAVLARGHRRTPITPISAGSAPGAGRRLPGPTRSGPPTARR